MTTDLSIKDVAEASGFSANTLRYYERIGLLPEPARTAAGYRIYDQRTLERLAFIARTKQLGCSLAEITGLMTAWEDGQCGPIQDQLRHLVADKVTAAQQQLVELATFTNWLREAATVLERHRPAGACDDECGCVTDPAVAPGNTALAVELSATPATADTETAITCSLSPASMNGRLDEWQRLLDHVERRERLDGGMRVAFARTVPVAELMRLVTSERDCCQFFGFAITVDARGIALEVRAPSEAQLIVESVFGVPA